MKEEKLKHASEIKWILIVCLLIVALSGLIIYRNLSLKRKNEKLESQKTQSELQLKASELEMQALRAQMNPHFIFNCLSSINRFILKSETEAASDYLTKFSRLIRMVLTNSNKPFISLEDELDMLRLYLDMERLRFKDSFDYSIRFTNSIEGSNVFVPPLLLQPFVENAIWHGLMHKEGQGHIEIELSADKRILTCIISDNGIGRSKASMFKSKSAEKQKSVGLRITTERLALLNKNTDEKTFFNVEDVNDAEGNVAGTRVILKMNYKGLIETSSDDLIIKS
jgi:sensor histidine kinase YesM